LLDTEKHGQNLSLREQRVNDRQVHVCGKDSSRRLFLLQTM
jgi:hypothetical protein